MQVTITVPKEDEEYLTESLKALERDIQVSVSNIIEDSRKRAWCEANPTPEYIKTAKSEVQVSFK